MGNREPRGRGGVGGGKALASLLAGGERDEDGGEGAATSGEQRERDLERGRVPLCQ